MQWCTPKPEHRISAGTSKLELKLKPHLRSSTSMNQPLREIVSANLRHLLTDLQLLLLNVRAVVEVHRPSLLLDGR